MNTETISTENRLLAALAHGSIFAQGVGILVGVIVYITQRDKSHYAAFQALQAAVFQFINLIIAMAMWVIWGVFYGLSMIPLVQQPNSDPPALFWISLVSIVIPLGFMVIVGLYGLWGAIRTFQGKDFRYFLLGVWLEKSDLLKPESLVGQE